ncbi:MAG: hypothetical protein ACLUKP_11370 [Thomasclavelia ramosa]|uniref:hypothetical protein n=1 Tax=Amedibacterium intestinale TaxID=2583452 RepID=UPI001373BFA1|nr:hypothetical protein [Amedibacterium intestinale]BBK63262.1 hypothetical protein A9CBEGH2_22020 [Amedibacterium intestinale]
MKKIGLLTLGSKSFNYGGVLQQFGLFQTINNLGFECEIIDYDVNSELNMFSYK